LDGVAWAVDVVFFDCSLVVASTVEVVLFVEQQLDAFFALVFTADTSHFSDFSDVLHLSDVLDASLLSAFAVVAQHEAFFALAFAFSSQRECSVGTESTAAVAHRATVAISDRIVILELLNFNVVITGYLRFEPAW